MAEKIDLSLQALGSGDCYVLRGEVSLATFLTLRDVLYRRIDQGHVRVALDINGVDYFDTTGLGLLIGTYRRVTERKGRLVVICQNAQHLRILSITRVDRIVEVVPTMEEAQRFLDAPLPLQPPTDGAYRPVTRG